MLTTFVHGLNAAAALLMACDLLFRGNKRGHIDQFVKLKFRVEFKVNTLTH